MKTKYLIKNYLFSGPWVRWEQLMPIWAPPVPDRRTIATELSHTMTSVTIRFRRSYFSDVHGKVISYAVIVTEDYSKPTDNKLSLLTWHDVQHFRLWPPYKTADPFYPFTNSSVEDYVIGVENCENKVNNKFIRWFFTNLKFQIYDFFSEHLL